MAAIGLRYAVYSPLTEDDVAGTHTYATGKTGRKMIKADISLNLSDAKLFADDTTAESLKEFIDGSISLNMDDLSDAMKTDLLGNTKTSATVGTETVDEMASKDTDIAPVVGFGFIQSKIVDKARKYRAIFFPKVQFGEPNESSETKGQSINWQTPVLPGTIMRRNDGVWKEEATVTSLETAITWLKSKVNLT
jgi:phi13 family phage major tail protein